jgi:DNA-binding NarL/FixJ family response regulator
LLFNNDNDSMTATTKTIRILLADDHSIVRLGLRALLEAEPDFSVIDEARDGLEVLEKVPLVKPDVVILDLMMPRLSGLEAVRQLARNPSPAKIIVLSMHDDEGFVLEALRHGVAGYVMKDSNSDYLIRAVRTVMAGRRYLSPVLADRAIAAYQQIAKPETDEVYESLTIREREVLQLTAEGRTRAEIAARLGVNARTVETHRANLMSKLNIHSKTELIRYAVRKRLVS